MSETDKGSANTPTVSMADVLACTTSAQLSRTLANASYVPPALQVRLLNKSGIAIRTRLRGGKLQDDKGNALPAVFVSQGDVLTDAHKIAVSKSFGFTITK